MNAMSAVPIGKKTDELPPSWVVCLVSGERLFVKAKEVFQDETSLVFHNGTLRLDWVIQIEKMGMAWFMPNTEEVNVLIVPAETEEYEDEPEE